MIKMNMASSYLNHPLLKNPMKWIRGITKRHQSDLYLHNFYDTSRLDTNPFLETLLDTRLDVSRTRFPMGNMVQMIVAGNPEKKSYHTTPVLTKPLAGQNPGSYVINNKDYIRFLSRKRFAPIPSKYKHKSPMIIGAIKNPPDFGTEIEGLYKNRILDLLNNPPISSVNEDQKRGRVLIKPGNSESVKWESNDWPVIYTPLVKHEISLTHTENLELILLFLKLTAFSKV